MKLLAILLLLTAAAGADDLIPQAFPKDRYAGTLGKSPFVLETKVAEPTVAPVNPFQNLYLRGFSKDENGKDYVLIQRLGEERPMKAFIGNEPGAEEFSVKSVLAGDSFRDTKVVLQKGTDMGTIGFKEDTISMPPAAANAGRGPMMPGMPQKPGGGPVPQVPTMRQPQIAAPSQPIPRPGGGAPVALPQPQPSIPQLPGGVPRTRLRQIPN